jgi:lysophospholipase L1-like esterase
MDLVRLKISLTNIEMNKNVVAFVGSSSTAGKGQAYDWISDLRRRSQNCEFHFCNFGVGGDLAHNALQHLSRVVAGRPSVVIVWVGGNDVLVSVSKKVRRFFRIWKHLPVDPSPGWFAENICGIAFRLKQATSAKIAFCSLAPIGEDLSSTDPFQSELNRHVEEYSGIIRAVALEEGFHYIPIYETMAEEVTKIPGQAFSDFRFLSFYRDAFRALILRKSTEEIAQMNGWSFHTDGVHLNRRGGLIVAELVQRFLDEARPPKRMPG